MGCNYITSLPELLSHQALYSSPNYYMDCPEVEQGRVNWKITIKRR